MTNDDGTHADGSAPDPALVGARVADAAGKRALVVLAMPHLLMTGGIGTAAVASMFAVVCAAGVQIVAWHGWARWLAATCVSVMVIALLVSVAWPSPTRRTFTRSDKPDTGADSWASVLAGLTSRSAWVWRLAPAPIVVLGGLGLLRWGLPATAAGALAAVAWVSVDLSTVATYPSRRRLYQLTRWISPPHQNGQPARWRTRLSAVPTALAEQDRALLERMVAAQLYLQYVERSPMVAQDGQISPAVLHGVGGLLALLAGDLIRRAETLNLHADDGS